MLKTDDGFPGRPRYFCPRFPGNRTPLFATSAIRINLVQSRPGIRWRSKLEETLTSCKSVAIFVGPSEMGSWQQRWEGPALGAGPERTEPQTDPGIRARGTGQWRGV